MLATMFESLPATWKAFDNAPYGKSFHTFDTHTPVGDDGLYIIGPSSSLPDSQPARLGLKTVRGPHGCSLVATYMMQSCFSAVVCGSDLRRYELEDDYSVFMLSAAKANNQLGDTVQSSFIRQAPGDGRYHVTRLPERVSGLIPAAIDCVLKNKIHELAKTVVQ